ncbi:MAG TPA: efflux RND transporter permease subunit [Phycisphaerae bacterium]|nr:efflux RND transporter permease subunit [Phycisphaerae bacterium]HNU44859.1 efflux RND transporter permease subunit [Phycisphaerae bacterium]
MARDPEHVSGRPLDGLPPAHHGFTNSIVRTFLNSNLSLILVLLATLAGVAALLVTPREEDPQIVVPLADVLVSFPGHSAEEVEQLVATPLEKLLYQIDGVEYVYSMSREDHAIITVRYYVGEDRERSLVKLYKTIDANLDLAPPGVTGWVVKPVEIDDVPIVTLTLSGPAADEYVLRRVAEELVERLAAVQDLSRAYVVGGQPRVVYVYLDTDRLRAHHLAPLGVQRALAAANVTRPAGEFTRDDRVIRVAAGEAFAAAAEVRELVVGVFGDRPVFLKDVAEVVDGPAEAVSYVRHGWGPARGFHAEEHAPGTRLGEPVLHDGEAAPAAGDDTAPAVTIALAKKKGSNAVWVAERIVQAAETLTREVVPDDIDVVITRNYGLTANEKVNELVEALAVAVFIVIALLTLGLGWREALIVAVAVPVVFGLTLVVNLIAGYTINRVTLFALILSLGLLVDDPIVDVENITRHFRLRKRASRAVVLEAVAEIRPPLITATLAVIVSFLPMFFITGMMGPYMRPMALNLPVTMLMSMLVAFTITPWLSYHVLKRRYARPAAESAGSGGADPPHDESDAIGTVKGTALYRLFAPLMNPLLRSRPAAWGFLGVMLLLMLLAAGLAATRRVPLKMLPFDNKNELLLVLNFDEGTTLERSDAAVRELEAYLAGVPEVTDFTSYVGLASPMDFNGLVRHYYLRQGSHVAEIRLNLAPKKRRAQQSHAIGLRLRDELTEIARRHAAVLQLVELPPGPPVIATVVAEVYGRPAHGYADLIEAARTVRARFEVEPGVVDVDDTIEAAQEKLVFVTDKEKAALHGISVAEIADTIALCLGGMEAGLVRVSSERRPLRLEVLLPRPLRSSAAALAQVNVQGDAGHLVPLAELGRWERARVDQTIYHKNLERVAYVFAETAGVPPAGTVVDLLADRFDARRESAPARVNSIGAGWVETAAPRPLVARTYLRNGGDIAWHVPEGFRLDFAGEGEWKITLDVFRDLGLAFAAALVGIYILLVAQTRSFVIPLVVMLAIPLTVIGIMPGFWLLNLLTGGQVGGYADPVFFTATGMIGMIALAGIVTRQAIIIIDFIHLALGQGYSLADAILASCVVRLRPILLTVSTAMLSAVPITLDPIFSGLAWALIFGLFASTVFTLFVIPVAYWLLYAHRPGHGMGLPTADRA